MITFIGEIERAIVIQGLVNGAGDFKLNPFAHWKPMQLLKKREGGRFRGAFKTRHAAVF